MKDVFLDKAFDSYTAKVYQYATIKFNEIVKPYLIRAGYSFYAGMGDYHIERVRDGATIYHDDLPKYIKDVLSIEIPGMDSNDLGSLMPDFEYKEGMK